ncbi:MAG: NADH-dependent alcohol dehydrogenase [Halobacteriovoraceae bacterium]|nr:NADH-dependent alcohol dehydrogenase [Halobacteriovoraceae bacterium]|tara:strand:- start:43063 stop:44214 length:1152 start_codon:yes stop_codon:yes gene_type:complete
MQNFEFYNPVKIVFGKEQIKQLETLVPQRKKVMMLYGGGSIKSNGVYDQVVAALGGREVIEFSGIGANPQYDKMMEAIELAKKEDVEFLLAVGGGSVIDATKFVAASVHFEKDPWTILSERQRPSKVLPFGVVLTLPATGSEMNCFSVISKGDEKLGFGGDPRLFSKFSILDPEVTYSLNERQLGNGVVDAFVHVVEQYLTKPSNAPLQDRFAEGILQTLIEEGPKVIHVNEHYESRANVMWCATMALNGLIGSGIPHDWSTHMIGHELTGLFGIDHARTLAAVLPSVLRVQKENKREKLLQYARRVWNVQTPDADKSIEEAILLTEDFFNSMGLPTRLRVYKVEEKDIESIIKSLRNHIPVNLGENQDIDEAKVEEILRKAL